MENYTILKLSTYPERDGTPRVLFVAVSPNRDIIRAERETSMEFLSEEFQSWMEGKLVIKLTVSPECFVDTLLEYGTQVHIREFREAQKCKLAESKERSAKKAKKAA